MVEEKLITILERELTAKVFKDLVSYAEVIINISYLWRRVDKVLPEGKTAEDFVHDIIVKIYDGTRKWDPIKYPNTFAVLKQMVRSELSSVFKRKENKVTTKTLVAFDDELEIDIEDEKIDQQTLIELQESLDKIYELTSDDEEVQEVILCYEEAHIYKRREIADCLGITPDEVTNRLKRLARKIGYLKEE